MNSSKTKFKNVLKFINRYISNSYKLLKNVAFCKNLSLRKERMSLLRKLNDCTKNLEENRQSYESDLQRL